MSERVWRCGRAARWLPRVLAASLLASGSWVGFVLGPEPVPAIVRPFRSGLVVVAGAVAWWIVRRGGELRWVVTLGESGLAFRAGARCLELAYRDIAALRYEAPFSASRSAWLPALALIDRDGVSWRISALVHGGEGLVEQLLEASGRADLAGWAEAFELERKMAAAGRRVAIGYVVASLPILATGMLRLAA